MKHHHSKSYSLMKFAIFLISDRSHYLEGGEPAGMFPKPRASFKVGGRSLGVLEYYCYSELE